MQTWVRRSLLAAVVLAAVAGVAFAAAVQLGERKLARRVDVAAPPVAYRTDAGAVERGGYLYRSRGCADCHGADGAGAVVLDDPNGMRIVAPDITRASGSSTAAYREVDWVRAVRHGIRRDGRPAMVMPSEDYNRLTDADLAALVAHVRQLPAATAGRTAEIRFPAVVKALYAAGLVRDAAEKIDHRLPPAEPVAEGVSIEHGRYVAQSCKGCHRGDLSGGKIVGAPPSWPAAPRLRAGEGSVMPRYASAGAFAAMLKTGRRPDGSAVSPVMPFAALGAMSDVDVRALHLYLSSAQSGS